MLKEKRFFLIVWILPSFLWSADILPEKIVRNVEEKLRSVKTIKMDFRETYIWKLTGEENSIEGELLLEGENRFRITTEDQVIVSDGKTLWTYSKPSHRVLIDRLSDSDNTVLPRQILFRYTQDYHIRMEDEEEILDNSCYVIEFSNETGDVFIPHVRVWIDKKEWIPRKVKQIDLSGNQTIFLLHNVQINIPLDEKIFRFVIPKDSEVIDLK